MSQTPNVSSVTNAILTGDVASIASTNGTQATKAKPKKLGLELVTEIQRFLTRRLIGVTMTLQNYKDALANVDPIVRSITANQVKYFENYASTIKDLLDKSGKADQLLDPIFNETVESCLRAFQASQSSSQAVESMPESSVGGTAATVQAEEPKSKDGLTGPTPTSTDSKNKPSSTVSVPQGKRGGK